MLTYLKAIAERAVKSAAQATILAIGADQLDVLHADWEVVLGAAGGGFLLSVLTSLASLGVGADGPSLVGEVVEPTQPSGSQDPGGAGADNSANATTGELEAAGA